MTNKLMIYRRHDELGELPCAVLEATEEKVRIANLSEGDLMEFDGRQEVVVSADDYPSCNLGTLRRAKDGIGIEIVNRGQAGKNADGKPAATAYPLDLFDIIVHKGRGYAQLNKTLTKYGL